MTKNTFWMVTAIIDEKLGIKKDRLMQLMSEKGIECRPFFHPLSSLKPYQQMQQAKEARYRNKVSYQISPYGLNLPSSMKMSEDIVGFVCDRLIGILQK